MTEPNLSRKLAQMADVFAGHPEIHMDRMSAGQFAAALALLADHARALEADVDRLTWALGAARESQRNADVATMAQALREVARMVADEAPSGARTHDFAALDAAVKDGRVTLFPRSTRPAFCDGGAS